MTMRNNDDYICAIHESAHAVVAAMGGADVKCIVLHQGSVRGARGLERGRCELCDATTERDADMPRFIRYLLAGSAAEKRATGRYSERDRDDVSHAHTLTWAMLDLEPDDARVKAHFNSEQTIVDAWMWDDTIWGWVTRVADALVKKRRLTGRDVHELRPAEARR
jgi:hypothetical protein